MKAVLHYIFLVGLPILGVVGLLKLGSTLQAPASIGGTWLLQWQNDSLANCGNLFDSAVSPLLTISQSGTHLVLELNTLEKTSLKATFNDLTITTNGSGAETAVFQATVDRQSEPNQLTGTLTLPQCPTPLSLVGIRQPKQAATTGGH